MNGDNDEINTFNFKNNNNLIKSDFTSLLYCCYLHFSFSFICSLSYARIGNMVVDVVVVVVCGGSCCVVVVVK